MNEYFACCHSEENRQEANAWVREIIPDWIPTYDGGEIKHKEDVTHWYKQGDVETLMLELDDMGDFAVSVASDMWCGVAVVGKFWTIDENNLHSKTEKEYRVWARYDYGMLPHGLAACVLQLRALRESEGIQYEKSSET